MRTPPEATLAFQPNVHDHAACRAHALSRADQVCAARGLRFTAMRRRVLELIWTDHKPSKAYDLLDKVHREHDSAAPPTVYRALDFLQQAGLVHHLESLDAFVGCGLSECEGAPQFLICRACERVAEMTSDRLTQEAAEEARAIGFHAEREITELHGLCHDCLKAIDFGNK